MNEQQLKQFLYCCQKESLKLHFNNIDGIATYMDERLENQTFLEALYKQKNLLNRLGTGICFSMSAWVFDLLGTMDVNNYYFMESHDGHWSNFVILYETEDGYKICDLADEVRKNEFLINRLFDADSTEVLELHKKLTTPRSLVITPEEYTKEYPIRTCMVLDHRGNEETMYYDVPRINLKDFLLKEKNIKHDRK